MRAWGGVWACVCGEGVGGVDGVAVKLEFWQTTDILHFFSLPLNVS